MKIENAIKAMRNLDDVISITASEHESVRLAIKALEKQIPKKPTLVIDESQNPPLYRCPCGLMSYQLEYEYCDECGQKLDWGED